MPPPPQRLTLPAPSTRAPATHHHIHTLITLTRTITTLQTDLSSLPPHSAHAPAFQQELEWALDARHALVQQIQEENGGGGAREREVPPGVVVRFCMEVVGRGAERGWEVGERRELKGRLWELAKVEAGFWVPEGVGAG